MPMSAGGTAWPVTSGWSFWGIPFWGWSRPVSYTHLDLYRDVACRGCLLSEFPPGTPPNGRNFPRRNRIISGLDVYKRQVQASIIELMPLNKFVSNLDFDVAKRYSLSTSEKSPSVSRISLTIHCTNLASVGKGSAIFFVVSMFLPPISV